jgi:hypothetical protein
MLSGKYEFYHRIILNQVFIFRFALESCKMKIFTVLTKTHSGFVRRDSQFNRKVLDFFLDVKRSISFLLNQSNFLTTNNLTLLFI